MNDTKQSAYLNVEKNRYEEYLLYHPPKHTKTEANIIITILKKREVKEAVEFGSGNGRLTILLLQNKISVKAVDISIESLGRLSTVAFRMDVEGLFL